jgi:hypothetical protein
MPGNKGAHFMKQHGFGSDVEVATFNNDDAGLLQAMGCAAQDG